MTASALLPFSARRRAACAAVRVALFHLHAPRLSTSDGTLCSAGCASLSNSDHQIASLAPHPPCPRRPSPDTASTFALAQGQQEGDKRRAQARAQVPDAAPSPVNHTSRTRQSLHRGLPLRFYFGTRCRSLLIFSHYSNTGGRRLHWPLSLGNPWYRDSPKSRLAILLTANPWRRSPNLGRIAVILRASKPSKRHRLGEGKRLCANAALVPRGTDGHDLQIQPLLRHKESCIRIRTQSGRLYQGLPSSLRYIRLYLIFVLYELSSALSLGKHLLAYTLKRERP